MNRRVMDIVGAFVADGQKTGVERYDRYVAAAHGRLIVADEVGSPEWQAGKRDGSKLDLIRARQAATPAAFGSFGD